MTFRGLVIGLSIFSYLSCVSLWHGDLTLLSIVSTIGASCTKLQSDIIFFYFNVFMAHGSPHYIEF